MKQKLFRRWLAFLLVIGLVFCSVNAEEIFVEEPFNVEEEVSDDTLYKTIGSGNEYEENEQLDNYTELSNYQDTEDINETSAIDESYDSIEIVYEDFDDNEEVVVDQSIIEFDFDEDSSDENPQLFDNESNTISEVTYKENVEDTPSLFGDEEIESDELAFASDNDNAQELQFVDKLESTNSHIGISEFIGVREGITDEEIYSDYAFEEIGIDKVYAQCDINNPASLGVMRKIGMKCVNDKGTRTYPRTGITSGEYTCMITRDEWENLK